LCTKWYNLFARLFQEVFFSGWNPGRFVMGRPREFDVDEALDRAMRVFWQKGYEGTTIPDLTEAMGINRPSLYAAFGSKEELFRKALVRYSEQQGCFMEDALKEPKARTVTERLLASAIKVVTDRSNPKGCLMVQGALACGDATESVRKELISRRLAREVAIRERFERAKSEGDLPADSHPADLARYVVTLIQGIAVQAAGGASRAELQRVAEIAMKAW
jgi:AcrR family transcriptional regulator